MAIKASIFWEVYDKSTNERVESTTHTTFVNDYTEIQPKMLTKLSNSYEVKQLENDLKIQDKLGASKSKGGYFIRELEDDSKTHDIIIVVSIHTH